MSIVIGCFVGAAILGAVLWWVYLFIRLLGRGIGGN